MPFASRIIPNPILTPTIDPLEESYAVHFSDTGKHQFIVRWPVGHAVLQKHLTHEALMKHAHTIADDQLGDGHDHLVTYEVYQP